MIRRPELAADLSPKDFRTALTQFVENYRAQVELQCAGFQVDEAAQLERRARTLDPDTSFRFFAETYFPHYLTAEPSLLHLHLFDHLPKVAARRGARDVTIAPRGAAKSTLISLIYPVWRDLIRRSRYIIVVMDSYAQAALQLEAIKAELETNPRLLMDFPELTGRGRIWREGEIVTRSGMRIEGVGSGMKLRGRRHGPYRPDLVILDDIENDENVRSPEQRDKLESWVLKAVMRLGPADGSLDLLHIGTVVHWDAVILRNARRPGWKARHFKALMKLPDDMTLWDGLEEILRNEGEDAAREYYEQNRVWMDDGAVLNWPAMQTLLQLMMERIESPSAFASEQQGEPTPENAPFQVLVYWTRKSDTWLYFGAVDPSLGKAGKSRDPSAILIGGLDVTGRSPILHVVEASIRKRLPDTIISDIITMQREYGCQLWAVESVQFQEFLRTELMTRALQQQVILPALPVNNISDKTLRIERLQPYTATGAIRLHASQSTLIQQLQQWPYGDHDDGPDCLEMLWSLAITHGAGAITSLDALIGAPARSDTFGGYRL